MVSCLVRRRGGRLHTQFLAELDIVPALVVKVDRIRNEPAEQRDTGDGEDC